MKPPIHSNKHYVQRSLSTVLAGAIDNEILAVAVDAPAAGNATQVATGCIIKAVYVELWVRTQDVSPGTVLVSVIKVPGAGGIPTFAQHIALHSYNNKKNVFYHTQGLINDQDADAIPFIRQWIKIPKSKQRFGLDDILTIAISAQALDNSSCGFATYKEYT